MGNPISCTISALPRRRGEVTALVGRNGAGKSTTLKAIVGAIRRTGTIRVGGADTLSLSRRKIFQLGLGYVPEERGIFSTLTVHENLMLPRECGPGGMSIEEIYKLFPNIPTRLKAQGDRLSGGEQQMLAIARILRTGARIILLDEPTEGLAPVIVQQIERVIGLLGGLGFTIVLIEQNLDFAMRLADRHVVIEEGRVVDQMPSEEARADQTRLKSYMGL